MKRLMKVLFTLAVFASLSGGVILIDPPTSNGAETCTWGQIKCCYADPPCWGTKCCEKPKDEGTDDGAWAPYLLRQLLWPLTRTNVALSTR